MIRVCAVVVCAPKAGEVLQAVRGQSRPADSMVVAGGCAEHALGHERMVAVPSGAGVAGAARAGLKAALADGPDWLWLLDGRAVPAPRALEHLLAVLDDLGNLPTPALLAGNVVAGEGEPHPDALPINRLTHKEVVIEACRHRLVSVRAVRHGSVLVSRAALENAGLPRADYVTDGDDVEWTARILRDADGYLVPASTSFRSDETSQMDPLEPTCRSVRNQLDMLRGPAWSGEEKLWIGFNAVAGLGRGLRAHPRAAGQAARGVWAGLRSSPF